MKTNIKLMVVNEAVSRRIIITIGLVLRRVKNV